MGSLLKISVAAVFILFSSLSFSKVEGHNTAEAKNEGIATSKGPEHCNGPTFHETVVKPFYKSTKSANALQYQIAYSKFKEAFIKHASNTDGKSLSQCFPSKFPLELACLQMCLNKPLQENNGYYNVTLSKNESPDSIYNLIYNPGTEINNSNYIQLGSNDGPLYKVKPIPENNARNNIEIGNINTSITVRDLSQLKINKNTSVEQLCSHSIGALAQIQYANYVLYNDNPPPNIKAALSSPSIRDECKLDAKELKALHAKETTSIKIADVVGEDETVSLKTETPEDKSHREKQSAEVAKEKEAELAAKLKEEKLKEEKTQSETELSENDELDTSLSIPSKEERGEYTPINTKKEKPKDGKPGMLDYILTALVSFTAFYLIGKAVFK